MTDRLARLIRGQLEVQLANGVDPIHLDGQVRIDYLKDMILACTDELHEALGEVGWKFWATSRHVSRDACLAELRDAWQFLTNAMLAVAQVSPEELADEFERITYVKQAVNHSRAANGYDGVSTKCQICRRALDDPGVRCRGPETNLGVNGRCDRDDVVIPWESVSVRAASAS